MKISNYFLPLWFNLILGIFFYNYFHLLSFLPIILMIAILFRKQEFQLNIKLIFLIPLYLLTQLILSFIFGQLNHFLPDLGLTHFTLISLKNILIVNSGLFVLSLLSYLSGLKILNLCKIRQPGFTTSLGVGLMAIILSLLLLLLLPGPSFIYALCLIPIILIWQKKEVLSLVKKLKKTEIRLENKQQILIFICLFLLTTGNLLIKQRSFPIEYDSFTAYANTARNLAQLQFLPPQWIHPPILETLLGFGYFCHPLFLCTLTTFLGILAMLPIYQIVKKQTNQNTALIALGIYYCNQNVYQLSSYDDKIDLGVLFFTLLSLYNLYQWFREKKDHQFFLGFIFLGFALSIKQTVFFLVPGAILLLLCLWMKKQIGRKKLLLGLISLGIFLFPWFIAHNIIYPPHNLTDLVGSLYSNQQTENSEIINQCLEEYKLKDFDSYLDRSSFPNTIRSISDKFFSKKNEGRISLDIIVLALLPLIFTQKWHQLFPNFLSFTLIPIIPWVILTDTIPWYYLPSIVLFQINLMILTQKNLPEKIRQLIFVSLTGYIFLCHSYNLINLKPRYLLHSYEMKYITEKDPASIFKHISEKINQDLLINEENKILVTRIFPGFGAFPEFWIDQNWLTTANRRNEALQFIETDPSQFREITQKMREDHIDYFLNYRMTEEEINYFYQEPYSPERGFLPECFIKNKINFQNYLQQETQLIWEYQEYAIYQLNPL